MMIPLVLESEIIEGYRYITSRQEIFSSYASDFIVMVLCNPVALYPALAVPFQQEKLVGMLYAFPSFGAFLMTLTSRWTLFNSVKEAHYGIARADFSC